MPDSIMYQENDNYVVLETGAVEQFLNPEELLDKLESLIMTYPENVPRELNKFHSVGEKARYLLENYCDFDLEPGQYLQWYAVRLEK